MNENSFVASIATGLERVQEQDRKKLVSTLSHCSPVLDLPPELVVQLLKIKQQDLWKLQAAIKAAEHLKLSSEEMGEILDEARVARIMEEEPEPSMGPTGPTGVQGATGPTGSTGVRVRGAQAQIAVFDEPTFFSEPLRPAKKFVNPVHSKHRGSIRGPQSPRRR